VTATAAIVDRAEFNSNTHAVASEARRGLTRIPKSLAPWLFYDEAGSELFEQITDLPEYYLTRTERGLLEKHSGEILSIMGIAAAQDNKPHVTLKDRLTIAELGAGTATKTRILLRALGCVQPKVLYQPIDVSGSALESAQALEGELPGLCVRPLIADYVAETYQIERPPRTRVLALYIGSSIGNFAPEQAHAILTRLRTQLQPGDGVLLGADLAPGLHKSIEMLRAAYDDVEGVTAAFNRNILSRLNRELGANFCPERFAHVALWNARESRIEMHLESSESQTVEFPANCSGPCFTIDFRVGETIHTENSYKFTQPALTALLSDAGLMSAATFTDSRQLFALNLAKAK
jgi:L-histidine N-alpha-methyltransferase